MLKLIYTENLLHLEALESDLLEWIERQQRFAASVGEQLVVSQSAAAFLLPTALSEAAAINDRLRYEGVTTVTATRCDIDRVEIGLQGYWLATDLDTVEGAFVTQLPERVETYLYQLWDRAQFSTLANDNVLGRFDSIGDER
jgi:hypothetical protein